MRSQQQDALMAGGTFQPGYIPNPAMIINPDPRIAARRRSQIGWVKRYAAKGDMQNASRVARQLGATVQDVLSGRVQNDGMPVQRDAGFAYPSALNLGAVTGTAANVGLFGLGWFTNGLTTWLVMPQHRGRMYNYYGHAGKDSAGKYKKSTLTAVERAATVKAVLSPLSALFHTAWTTLVPNWLEPTAVAGLDVQGRESTVARTILRFRSPFLTGTWGHAAHAVFDKWLSRDPSSRLASLLRAIGSMGPMYKGTQDKDGKWTLAKDADGRYILDYEGWATHYILGSGKKTRLDNNGNVEMIEDKQDSGTPPANKTNGVGDAWSREVWDPSVTIPPPVPIPVQVGCGQPPAPQPAQVGAPQPMQIPAPAPAQRQPARRAAPQQRRRMRL